jgi:hypothetical protein
VNTRDLRQPAWLPVFFLLLGLAACSADKLSVTSIQLGRSLNGDKTVSSFTSRFAPTDSVYVSVLTTAGSGTIGVRWKYGTRQVGEANKPVSYRDNAATEFRLQNADRFPPGDYTVEVFLNGQSVGVREFAVERQY